MREIWKDVAGYEGIYQVSNFGCVRSCERVVYSTRKNSPSPYRVEKENVKKPIITNSGYYRICLQKCGNREWISVHRLVAQTFIPNPENKPQVNHIDGNRLNNRVDNLEWATMSENVLHAYRTGLNYGLRGDLSPHKVAVFQFEKDGTFVKRWSCMAEAARAVGGCKEGVYDVCSGKRGKKTYKGYIWKYADAQKEA